MAAPATPFVNVGALSGYRTYLVAAGLALVVGAHALGWLSDGAEAELLKVLGAGGLAALRSGIAKIGVPQA